MKPDSTNRTLVTGSAQASASFGISLKDEAHLMGILREGLYTDRILAVLREYSANAWDAHRSVGKHTTPIEVFVPTADEPVLRIRDHGTGLSHEDMFAVFTQYGSSTKRDSDDVVGMLGIGSKSGFAYADTFTVISYHGGHKRTYVAALDESEKGSLSLLADEPSDETGVEIQITTKGNDWYEWQRKAGKLYRHFDPRPSINIELPAQPADVTKLTNGSIRLNAEDADSRWIAIMGCVPYRVNLDQLDDAQLPKCLRNLSGMLTFKIGEVSVSASREELKYTAATKAALIERFTALVDEYVTQALKMLESKALPDWEQRLRVRVLQKMELPLPEHWKEQYGQAFVQVKYDDKSGFLLLHNSAVTTRVTIDADTTLWIDDAGKDLKGYELGVDDYVVRSKTLDAAALRAVLDVALADSKLTGIKIKLLSEHSWAEWRLPKKKVTNPKHRAKMFQHVGDGRHSRGDAYSDHWEPVTRVAEDTDVFVLLEAFKPYDDTSWYSAYGTARDLTTYLGETMPEIYGYKTTEKKPVNEAGLSGTSWKDWYTALRTRAAVAVAQHAETYHWAELSMDYSDPCREATRYVSHMDAKKDTAKVIAALGTSHPISAILIKVRDAKTQLTSGVRSVIGQLGGTAAVGTWANSEARGEILAMIKAYPLLAGGLQRLWGEGDEKAKHWHEYVRLIDAKDQLLAMAPSSPAVLKAVP